MAVDEIIGVKQGKFMLSKVLVTNPSKCNGCGQCQIACSLSRSGVSNPAKSRIQIFSLRGEARFLPVSCMHCEDAPCMLACPKEAIFQETETSRVMVDYNLCISCRMCVAACPFGAMGFDPWEQKVFKCDYCNGDPKCVAFCYPKALSFTEPDKTPYPQLRKSALKYAGPRR